MRKHCPHAVFVDCFSHCLIEPRHQCIEQHRKNTISIPYATLSDCCNLLKNSAQRVKALEKCIEEMCPEASHTLLKAFCPTRWVERHNSIFVFIELYFPFIQVLSDFEQYSLLTAVTAAPFILTVHILHKILGVTIALSVIVQSSNMDLVKTINHMNSVLQ